MVRQFSTVIGVVVCLLAGTVALAGDASAAGIAKPRAIHAHGFTYSFGNWDYDSNAHEYDNPVSIIFISRHPDMVDRVYGQINLVGLDSGGGKMHLSGTGGSRPGVDNTPWTSYSAGRKGAFGCWGHCTKGTDIHLRTYGPDGRRGTQIYQSSRGYAPYYLISTVHFDKDEHGAHPSFGYQDTARKLLVSRMTAIGFWHRVAIVSTGNKCNTIRNVHGSKSQHCQHDGTAWVISIDG